MPYYFISIGSVSNVIITFNLKKKKHVIVSMINYVVAFKCIYNDEIEMTT